MVEVKEQLRVAPGDAAPSGGFLLGSSAERYAGFVARANTYVLEDSEREGLAGFAITLPDGVLRATDVWARRREIDWEDDDWERLEAERVGYFEQVAVLPGCRYRMAAGALALRALADLLADAHVHVFATVVRTPFTNRASLRLLEAVGAHRVGQIGEVYDGVGRVVSDVYHLDRSRPVPDDPLTTSRLALRLSSYAGRIGVISPAIMA
jgi:hypothetical protein